MAVPTDGAAFYALFAGSIGTTAVQWGLSFVPMTTTAGATMGGITRGMAENFADSGESLAAAMQAVLITNVTVDTVRVLGLQTGETPLVYEAVAGWSGARTGTGDVAPHFMAAGFRSAQPAYAQRGQSFRLPGLFEGDFAGNEFVTTFSNGAAVNAFEAILNDLYTVVDAFTPTEEVDVLVGVIKRVEYIAPSGNRAYRLPVEPGDVVTAYANPTVAIDTFVTTQNSRKARP
jgi:hypothetical protein